MQFPWIIPANQKPILPAERNKQLQVPIESMSLIL
jgi:hypothetical protein